ncbi:hypothetical protein MOB66_07055 [Bacillus haynesii]|uniref:hypothetical protein n=1 Tax=Bacillus haynesii TaxID=1925021 RepID=UPI00227EC67D|nr:hypothetical protein [Bacillus haynesii]MCY7771228.1 hypothetical protein [Bacillus haynesii]MCY8012212.1 hypothetical protein [Bacillus haynesii]MEC0762631.1 hypothetical protein [Bacillus haynesii]MEC0783461.1 hypothetical protein [Bacillus haynesii]
MGNSNQYIEAAKIAAEAAAKNTQLTLTVSIISAIIALLGTGVSAYFSWKSTNRKTLIDTISAQRIEWVNQLRDKFVEFNKLANDQSYIMFKLRKETPMVESELIEKVHNLKAAINHIDLLLNPNEFYAKKLTNRLKDVVGIIFDEEEFRRKDFRDCVKDIGLIQQVILKAEWKRIKEETKRGRELTDVEVNRIYLEKENEIVVNSLIN